MARPSILRPIDGGEVILKNVTVSTKAKVTAALGPESKEEAEAPKVAVAMPYQEEMGGDEPKKVLPMPSTALGIYQDPLTLDYHMVTLKYSHVSKQGEVVDDTNCGRDKAYATERFRIAAVNKNLVG